MNKQEWRDLAKAIVITAWAGLLLLGMCKNIVWLIWPMPGVLAVVMAYAIIVGSEMLS
jgi:fatty acid desaturase